jgi:simple sugar transport system permease protein
VIPQGHRMDNKLTQYFKRISKKTESYLILFLIFYILLMSFVSDSFLTLINFFDLGKNASGMAILALGAFVVLLSGGIDLSFTAIAVSGQYISAKILLSVGVDNLLFAFALSCSIGIFLGFINGYLISRFKLQTLITTLGTLSVFHGALLTIFGTAPINASQLPQCIIEFGKATIFRIVREDGSSYGLSVFVLFVIGVVILTWFILRFTMLGRGIYVIGGNEEAARRTGFNVDSIKLFIYSYVGFLAGIMGVINGALIRFIDPTEIVGREINVIAAVVLGGASITGGKGSILGTLLGVFIISILNDNLVLIGLSSFWQRFFVGVIILAGAILTAVQSEEKKLIR